MKLQISFLCLISFCMITCQSYYRFTKSYETSVKVIDVLGNPVKNREVRLFITGYPIIHDSIAKFPQPVMTTTTNNLGECTFHYDLRSDDYAPDNAHILVKEDSNYVNVNPISHVILESSRKIKGVIKLSGTIKMDSVVPFKVRIISNRNNVKFVVLKLYTKTLNNNFLANDNPFDWSFVSFQTQRAPSTLDTIITTKVLLRTPFLMDNHIQLSDGNQLFGDHLIDSNDVRQVLLVNEINK